MPMHTIAPAFTGSLPPPAIIVWLNLCEDSFANYNKQKPNKPLSVAAQIHHADLDTQQSALGTTGAYGISDTVMKKHLLFFTNEHLTLCIMANPTFDLETITLESLMNLLIATLDSLCAEGSLQHGSGLLMSDPVSACARTTILSPKEFKTIQDAGGCFRCKKTPKSANWTPHKSQTCPGNNERGIPPGHNYQQPKTESVAVLLLIASVNVVMPPADLDDDAYDSYEEYSHDSEIMVTVPWDS
ncbi:hypothetical protein BS17DRAFT_813220 [Gyrodon lividus]|nr:hypothetical protein BS17DRAFT_813220 [Gyrodon lividus]